ncbi:28S ribosomal protein S11, mitochondrial-like [Homarus americanus]|uniref:28S ribosomal protein S11, mitochondrial-like n=1 Tax=Homarus americanus TaxID=6706 RepID=UPI001C47FEA3|nr:28S ribosomal protein S11, mitochondrial-like [Homarus americanus]
MLRKIAARTIQVVGADARRLKTLEVKVNYSHRDMWVNIPTLTSGRHLHLDVMKLKSQDRKEMLASMPQKDEGTEGEVLYHHLKQYDGMFPDENTPDLLFDGVRFADLPILHARFSKNNTLLTLTDAQGVVKMYRSCGLEGFKNTRKGTNIAAQATAISLATRALDRGLKNVRVKVAGLGPGRMVSVNLFSC